MNFKLKFAAICLVAILLTFQSQAIARAPKPFCTSKTLYKQFALSSEELVMADTSNFFSGYNLNITLPMNPDQGWASVSRKWNLIERKNQYFPNIISHFIEPKDNSVGRDSFLLYKTTTGAIMLSYGILRNQSSLPDVTSTVIISTDSNIECFDAALFLDHGLAVVDCVKKGASFFSTHSNLFYIADLTNHSIKKIVENDLYIGFKTITKRKLMKFSHPQAGGFTYLLRSHFSDSVDVEHSDNTYMQIFIVPVEDPTTIQPLRVIDRTFLNIKTLRIMDAQIYLDDIFLLDYDTGLYRLDILQSQRVAITGRYRDYGFQKFGVYSDDYEDELIIALSNKHSVYQISWHHTANPTLLNKYSLMENSRVKQVMLNDRYLIVQSAAKAYNETHPEFQIDYTWIFTKGSRTYLNAYHIIYHNSSIVEVEFDREKNHIYIADQSGLALWEITEARLVLHYMNQSWYGTSKNITIVAESHDRYSNESFRCEQKFIILFVSSSNLTLLPTGIDMTSSYSVNYPNPLEIPLEYYYRGPNIQYQLLNHKGDQLPSSWINKINRTTVKISPPLKEDIVFFHTDIIPDLGHEFVIYYYQDNSNNTHVAECIHQWARADMNCQVRRTYNHTSRIRSLKTTFFRNQQGWSYLYIMVLEGEPKNLYIYDFMRQLLVAEVTYKGDYEAEITSVATSFQFLYVLRKNAKTIDVYSLRKCVQFSTCAPDFSITQYTLKALGIRYFSPTGVVTDLAHPEVIFIKCLGSLIILDIDNKQKIHLLDEIISAPTGVANYQVAVNRDRMVVVAYPDLVFEYSLEHIYTHNMVTLTKVMPLYGMRIQPNADIEFSDFDSTVYINAYNPTKNISVIMIYRTGHAASHSLYTMIELDKLYSRPGFQVQVSGFFVNFVTIIAGTQHLVYRVFDSPFLTINETQQNFSFKLQAYNNASSLNTEQINVTVVNQKQIIEPTQFFTESNLNLSASNEGNYQWQDREWFTGNIIHYNYTCQECHKGANTKVRIREHIDNLQDLHIGGNYYAETLRGGLSVWGDLFRFRPNGTVHEVVNLPDQKQLQRCLKVAAAENEIFAVTACQELGRGVNLYVTSFTGYKPFTWGPFLSPANQVRSLQIVNDILMLTDTPANPEYRFQEGAVYLYKLSFNPESGDEMDELEIIDSNDFVGCPGWSEDVAYLGNSHMAYSRQSNAYRLYITQARYGLFVVDFVKAHATDTQITILATSYINMKQLLEDNSLHMPNDASFLAVSFVKSIYNPVFDTENVIITTLGYHNFQVTLIYDKSGRVQKAVLYRLYQRYSFYNAVNQVHSRNGFILVSYVLPPNIDQTLGYRKQYVTLYDSIDYPHQAHKGYSQHFMIGAIPLNETTPAGFAINSTYDFHSNGTRSGIVISLPISHRLIGGSIAHNLTLSVNKGYKSQRIDVLAYNDFSSFKFNATLTEVPDDDKKQDTIVIIIIILCGIVFVFFMFYIFSILKKKKPTEQRQSLLTENQNLVRQSVVDSGHYESVVIHQQKHTSEQMVRQVHEPATKTEVFSSTQAFTEKKLSQLSDNIHKSEVLKTAEIIEVNAIKVAEVPNIETNEIIRNEQEQKQEQKFENEELAQQVKAAQQQHHD